MRPPILVLLAFAWALPAPLSTAGATQPRPPAPAVVQPTSAEAPAPLSIVLPAGPARAAERRLVQPYAQATETVLGEPAWDGTATALRALITSHQADLALVGGPALAALCRAQLLDRLDWGRLGRDRFVPGAATDCGAGAYMTATVLAWDRDKVPAASGATLYAWTDFWDVARHPGRRGLRRAARGNLEVALLADNVSPGDVYRTLRSADGVDRAFRKLDQLKPYIEWWDQPSQAAQFLASAKVLMTSASVETLRQVGHAHPDMQWAGCLTEFSSWVQPAGAPHKLAAQTAILIASDPARVAGFARETGLGPATLGGVALLPAGSWGNGLPIDEGFWLENGEKLEARFAAWVSK